MPITKIPSPAAVRRALTTLKRYGAIKLVDLEASSVNAMIALELDKTLLSAKKTSRKKPKHKIVKPKEILPDCGNKSSAADGDL